MLPRIWQGLRNGLLVISVVSLGIALVAAPAFGQEYQTPTTPQYQTPAPVDNAAPDDDTGEAPDDDEGAPDDDAAAPDTGAGAPQAQPAALPATGAEDVPFFLVLGLTLMLAGLTIRRGFQGAGSA